MKIHPFILNEIKLPQFSNNIAETLKIFDKHLYSHLPVISGDEYKGCISAADARIFDPQKTIADYEYALEGFFAQESDNWMEVLHIFSKNDANIMPVLNAENILLGYIELQDIMNIFSEAPFMNNPGSVLIVEKGIKEYSFSEICQIIETNSGIILGAFVSGGDDKHTQITLKLGPGPLNAIFQTFRRYGYEVITQHEEDAMSSNLRERSRYLDKYLNI